jgi:hypothetical protein
MIRTEHFWEDEQGAPILERNYKFITVNNQAGITERVRGWMDLLKIDDTSFDFEKLRDTHVSEENMRIFRRDAERTYVPKDEEHVDKRTKARQDRHVETLKLIVAEVQDYHQGLGYIAGFLGLFLEPEEVVKIGLTLHRDPKYASGYFMGAPQRFVADAKVFYKILEKKLPNLFKHLLSKGVLPEMFAVKYFVGLCLHVLPFSALFEFYEHYLTQGNEYLFKFALRYVETFESELMSAKTTADIMTILRAEDEKADWKLPHELLERHNKDDVFGEIVNSSDSVDLDCDLAGLRESEAQLVAAAVETARKRDQELKDMYSDDEIVFSDEEEEDD